MIIDKNKKIADQLNNEQIIKMMEEGYNQIRAQISSYLKMDPDLQKNLRKVTV